MRVFEGMEWKHKEGLKELRLHIDWIHETLPIMITEPMVELIESGTFYMYGRDRSLCPIMHLCPRPLTGLKLNVDEAIMATHFVAQYVKDHMMYAGKVENWLTIMDVDNMSVSALPKSWIFNFVKAFNHHYYQRNKGMFLMNISWGVNFMWKLVKPFIHHTTQQKLIFEKKSESRRFLTSLDEKLNEKVYAKQLQKKYGGSAKNVTVFWPPRCPSNDFDVAPHKIDKTLDMASKDSPDFFSNSRTAQEIKLFRDSSLNKGYSPRSEPSKLMKYCIRSVKLDK